MSNNAFIKALRQYASLSRRLNVLYWEAVDTLVAMRKERIASETATQAEYNEAATAVDRIVEREYPFAR